MKDVNFPSNKLLLLMSLYYQNAGKFNDAIDYANRALDICEKERDFEKCLHCTIILTSSYYLQGNIERAVSVANRGAKYENKVKTAPTNLYWGLITKAQLYCEIGKYHHAQKIIDLTTNVPKDWEWFVVLAIRTRIAFHHKNYDEAVDHAKIAVDFMNTRSTIGMLMVIAADEIAEVLYNLLELNWPRNELRHLCKTFSNELKGFNIIVAKPIQNLCEARWHAFNKNFFGAHKKVTEGLEFMVENKLDIPNFKAKLEKFQNYCEQFYSKLLRTNV